MKKLFVMVLLAVGLATFAQEGNKIQKRDGMEKLTPAQRDELRLKKLTLDLGLNENQQKEMAKIIAEQSAKRDAAMAERKANKEKGVKPTADERFARENKRLDEEIVMKERVKKILTPDQFKKWEDGKQERKERMKARAEKRGNKILKPE